MWMLSVVRTANPTSSLKMLHLQSTLYREIGHGRMPLTHA